MLSVLNNQHNLKIKLVVSMEQFGKVVTNMDRNKLGNSNVLNYLPNAGKLVSKPYRHFARRVIAGWTLSHHTSAINVLRPTYLPHTGPWSRSSSSLLYAKTNPFLSSGLASSTKGIGKPMRVMRVSQPPDVSLHSPEDRAQILSSYAEYQKVVLIHNSEVVIIKRENIAARRILDKKAIEARAAKRDLDKETIAAQREIRAAKRDLDKETIAAQREALATKRDLDQITIRTIVTKAEMHELTTTRKLSAIQTQSEITVVADKNAMAANYSLRIAAKNEELKAITIISVRAITPKSLTEKITDIAITVGTKIVTNAALILPVTTVGLTTVGDSSQYTSYLFSEHVYVVCINTNYLQGDNFTLVDILSVIGC